MLDYGAHETLAALGHGPADGLQIYALSALRKKADGLNVGPKDVNPSQGLH